MKRFGRLERLLVGRTITMLDINEFETGRKSHPFTTDPRLLLDDGKVVSFRVVETESGEYGVEIVVHE